MQTQARELTENNKSELQSIKNLQKSVEDENAAITAQSSTAGAEQVLSELATHPHDLGSIGEKLSSSIAAQDNHS